MAHPVQQSRRNHILQIPVCIFPTLRFPLKFPQIKFRTFFCAYSDERLELLPWHPKSGFFTEDISQRPAAMLVQKVALAAFQAQTGQVRHLKNRHFHCWPQNHSIDFPATHNIEAFTLCAPLVAVASVHREVPLVDIVDGAHQNRGVPQRGFDEGVWQRGDPPQPLLLPVEVHEEDAALELVPPRPAVVVSVQAGQT